MVDSPSRLERLQQAVDAFVAWQEAPDPPTAEAFLAAHPDLRPLLEPMLDEAPIDPCADDAVLVQHVDAGTRLGDYVVLRRIGRGGMGSVYEAEQVSLARRVTLKVLHRELARSPQAVERFRGEAAAAARLRHPGIVPIFEVAERGGIHFFAMEYAVGRSLDQLLDNPTLGVIPPRGRPEAAATVVAEVAEALAYAHSRGVIHRDVKTHNILITEDGTARLLDFGLARDLASASEGSSEGSSLLGTPHAMSPEHILGGDVDARSDVFACGAVLFELLSQQRPFAGSTTAEILADIASEDPAPMGLLPPRTPRDLKTICATCLQKDPADRYSSATALAADLRAFLRMEPIAAQPPGAARRVAQSVRRRPALAAATALALVVAIGGPALYWVQQQQTEDAVADGLDATLAAESATLEAVHHLIAVLRDRLARQPQLEAGYESQIDRAESLCIEQLQRPAVAPHRRQPFGEAMLDIADLHHQLGVPERALPALEHVEQSLAADASPAGQSLRARVATLRASTLLATSSPDTDAAITEADAGWQPLENDDQLAFDARAARARLQIMAARVDLEAVDGLDRAMEHLESAAALLEEVPPAGPAAANHARSRSALHQARGRWHLHQRQYQAALAQYAAAQRWLDGTHAEPAAEAPPVPGATRPQPLAIAKLQAQIWLGSGTALSKLQRRAEARAVLRRVEESITPLRERFPSDAELQRITALTRLRLGSLAILERDYPTADRELDAALEEWERLHAAAPTPLDRDLMSLAVTCTQRANAALLRSPPDVERARSLYVRAIDAQTQLLAKAPNAVSNLTELGATHGNFAALENHVKRHGAARDQAERAIELQRTALAHRPQEPRILLFLGIHHAQWAYALKELDAPEEALEAGRSAIGYAPTHANTVRMCAETAVAVAKRQRADGEDAAAERSEALAVRWLAGLTEGTAQGVAALLASPRFDALRARSDFRELVEAVRR